MSLVATDIYYSYPGRSKLLHGASLVVESGESVAIMAPSGTGKSTFLAILGGLVSPDSGDISFNGRDILTAPLEVAWIRQSMDLLYRRTLTENVALPLLARGRSRPEAVDIAHRELCALGLAHLMDERVCDVSGGEAQRAAVARAAVSSPAILLADEPTANLDAKNASVVAHSLTTRFESTCVVMATHDPVVAAKAQRSFVLVDGSLELSP